MIRLLCVIIGYAFGLMQTGVFVGKLFHTDIRKEGSGNSGATNALRTMGLKAGLMTFLGDLLKAVVAVLLVKGSLMLAVPEVQPALMVLGMYTGLGVIIGHDFPFYLNFKGGKGVAAMAGMIVATDLRMAPIPIIIFITLVALTKYVSLGSIAAAVTLAVQMVVFAGLGILKVGKPYVPEACGIMIFITLLTLFQHRTNIRRLLTGTENKISFHKK